LTHVVAQAEDSPDLFGFAPAEVDKERGQATELLQLEVTLDRRASRAELLWRERSGQSVAARGVVECDHTTAIDFYAVKWDLEIRGKVLSEHGGFDASSVHARLRAWRNKLPVDDLDVSIALPDGRTLQARPDAWKQLGTAIYRLMLPLREVVREAALSRMYGGVKPGGQSTPRTEWTFQVECYASNGLIGLVWMRHGQKHPAWLVTVALAGSDRLSWTSGENLRTLKSTSFSATDENTIRQRVEQLFRERPFAPQDAMALWVTVEKDGTQALDPEPPCATIEQLIDYIVEQVRALITAAREAASLGAIALAECAIFQQYQARLTRRAEKERAKADAARARQRETMQRLAAENREKEKCRERARREAELAREKEIAARAAAPLRPKAEPRPPVPVRLELAPLAFQDTALPLPDLRHFLLVERAAMWWVSNQSDDLLCLPHCRIQRLDYQIRTALRVLGPLRGRALLSDEVGLGKTIEACLVLKELVTRGLARRALVLTVPSLVDQWEEELAEKFSLEAATTNHSTSRAEAASFWSAHPLIVASLHTLKQPNQLAAAREVAWDCLIVDEAHHLRNRDSQSWQAVNALPRQFLLLLTATPVQNSLEELYNLVTLLQPGQFSSPREFRARHMDPKRPRQPRQPEELRSLLGQVMVRNTRASSGIELPPRHAETVLFNSDPAEREFWDAWGNELRVALDALPAGQSSLWGRLLLQAAGSSPAAWHSALGKFPNGDLARAWRERAPLDASWRRKCALIPPMAQGDGGCVIFTQFLDTQTALGAALSAAGVAVVSVNGSTPAPERQPLVERFRHEGGALLLTQSGTEGRNLQFCHQLINFDLPWNPMEIEQRIGRLHRLGQKHPVRIFNFVQNGTLQDHLLTILQEKLNLFELVVGETGLVLGERFSVDEFAEEVLRRWRSGGDDVAASFADLGNELAAARAAYGEVKALDESLFAQDYQTD
jgi:SNF2-related domain/Helicase conserved C-terminal domain